MYAALFIHASIFIAMCSPSVHWAEKSKQSLLNIILIMRLRNCPQHTAKQSHAYQANEVKLILTMR